jgi:hypothetical protein
MCAVRLGETCPAVVPRRFRDGRDQAGWRRLFEPLEALGLQDERGTFAGWLAGRSLAALLMLVALAYRYLGKDLMVLPYLLPSGGSETGTQNRGVIREVA